jgi:hypothetical protein
LHAFAGLSHLPYHACIQWMKGTRRVTRCSYVSEESQVTSRTTRFSQIREIKCTSASELLAVCSLTRAFRKHLVTNRLESVERIRVPESHTNLVAKEARSFSKLGYTPVHRLDSNSIDLKVRFSIMLDEIFFVCVGKIPTFMASDL